MQKIILFYIFKPLKDPEAIRLWQRELCETNGLKGRILIAEQGINGTLGGELKSLKNYIKLTKQYPAFKNITFKWSDGSIKDFPKLIVKVRSEIVTFGVPDKIIVDDKGVVKGGKKIKPKQLNELVKSKGKEVVFFDGRNKHEAAIGRFKDAIIPDVNHTRDFDSELDNPKYDAIKDKTIVTYCTGGIRCEVLSALMKQKGFEDVYQLDGGIAKYGETYKDEGLWEGSLFVFDDRMDIKFSDKAKDIGSCLHCKAATSNYENCAIKTCNKLILVCEACKDKLECSTCSQAGAAIY